MLGNYRKKQYSDWPQLEPSLLFGHLEIQGQEWKSLRRRFNPGFSHQHLISLLPCILDKMQRFLSMLDEYVDSAKDFLFDELCTNFTSDITGAIPMDVDIYAQFGGERQSELAYLYRELSSSYHNSSDIWAWLSPRVALRRRSLSRRLDNLIKTLFKKRFLCRKEALILTPSKLREVYFVSLSPHTLAQTCDQLKSFLSGHDTTRILLQWAFYELSRTPRAMIAIRAELGELFGLDSSPRSVHEKLLAHGEALLQKLSYTSAVIKETFRLYPPSGTSRYSPLGTGFNVSVPYNSDVCIDGVVVYNCETIIQRDEAMYGATKDDFVPERWLGNTDTATSRTGESAFGNTSVFPGAWWPFERGPRNCIGQELANIEVRVILACALRRYDWEKIGLGKIARNDLGEPIVKQNGQYKVKSELYNVIAPTDNYLIMLNVDKIYKQKYR
ncbi:cytochrome P450 [Penicillium cf. viridicatum]|uniref:Cytochrome P450 n=1 Tax=Penicillium cf. viridicatum TaxID=2972119 RepID=A0A9W9LXK5_9EURO|nr:cytochrome P450 [Penicillium cf. viridicatum]